MTHLQIGDKAPDFNALNEKGEMVSLSDFEGKHLVLYFYPADDTPTCTKEACNLRDNYHRFMAQGYEILGVSPDGQKKHLKFIKKYKLPFSLLADEDRRILNDYGVWGPKKFMGRLFDGVNRSTFVIDEKGIIKDIITDVKSGKHADQIFG
jgi:peroxiredoxin Q/BCP